MNDIPAVARPRAHSVRTTLLAVPLLAASLLVTACAPSPAIARSEPNPSPAEVTDAMYGVTDPPSARDVQYTGGAVLGCGPWAVSHDPCGGSQSLDVYPHDLAASPRGTIVFVHGGGFDRGDKADLKGIGYLMAQRQRGWDIVAVNYRLTRSGGAQWPTAVDDVAAAIAWIRLNGASVGVDAQRLVVAGHSAGGSIAALIGVAWNSNDVAYRSVSHVDGWISTSGILDFNFADGASVWAPHWSANRAARTRMSAVSFVDAADPPGYVIHGDSDRMVATGHSTRFVDTAMQRGASVRFDLVDRWADGTAMASTSRNHSPGSGVNLTALNSFLDRI